jgi:hypothetical protein
MKRGISGVLKHHFVPHHGNKHTPHAISHGALFGYSVGMVGLKFLVLAAAIAFPAASLFSSAITPANIISLTNASRSSLGLTPLSENSRLDASAQAKAEDMLAHQYFAHTSPDGVTPWSWIKGQGYGYRYAGENLAVYYTQAEDVTAGWMASPTHRANIVDTRYTDIGVGVAQGEYNGYPSVFVVQHFGKPAGTESAPTPAPTPVAPAPAAEVPASEPEPSPEPEPQSIAVVTPVQNAYEVTVKNPEATAVTAKLGTDTVALKKTVAGEWVGTMPLNAAAIPSAGQELVVVSSGNGEQHVETAAIVAPTSSTQDMYAFGNTAPEAKVLGIPLGGLKDAVTQIYLLVIVLLSAILLVTLISKMHWKRLPLAAHVIGVVGIAIILMAI